MSIHTFRMPEAKAVLVHKVVAQHMGSLKNWIASAVEQGKLEYAQELVKELREYETLYAAFNMPAKHDIAKATGKDLELNHAVRSAH